MCFLTTLRTRQYGNFAYDTKDRFANLKNEKGKHGIENVSIISGRRNSYIYMPGTNKRARFYWFWQPTSASLIIKNVVIVVHLEKTTPLRLMRRSHEAKLLKCVASVTPSECQKTKYNVLTLTSGTRKCDHLTMQDKRIKYQGPIKWKTPARRKYTCAVPSVGRRFILFAQLVR